MVLPTSPRASSSVCSLSPSSSVGGWTPPLVSPSSPDSSRALSTRKSTPIPPKRSFSSPNEQCPADKGQCATVVTLSPYEASPVQAGRRLTHNSPFNTPDSGIHRLVVPNSTSTAVHSPRSSPLLSVRHCLPLTASPQTGVRKVPAAPPASPASTVADKLARSAAFQRLIRQRTSQAEDGNTGEGKDERPSEEEENDANFTSSDEKRHSLSSSSGSRRGVDWMPVVKE